MAGIFKEIVITYKGKAYTIKPTFEMINTIEIPRLSGGLGISLSDIVARTPLTEVARLLAFFLQSQDVEVTDEEMYAELFDGQPSTITGYVKAIAAAVFPAPKNSNTDDKKK